MQQLIDALEKDGWTKYHDLGWVKRFDTPTKCRLNTDKPGLQVGLRIGNIWPDNSLGRHTFEIWVGGELANGDWLNIRLHDLPRDLSEALKRIPKLLALWEAANHG